MLTSISFFSFLLPPYFDFLGNNVELKWYMENRNKITIHIVESMHRIYPQSATSE